jgi:hypothetical protein
MVEEAKKAPPHKNKKNEREGRHWPKPLLKPMKGLLPPSYLKKREKPKQTWAH